MNKLKEPCRCSYRKVAYKFIVDAGMGVVADEVVDVEQVGPPIGAALVRKRPDFVKVRAIPAVDDDRRQECHDECVDWGQPATDSNLQVGQFCRGISWPTNLR